MSDGPRRAIVHPRVFVQRAREPLLIEDAVDVVSSSRQRPLAIALVGPIGAGKTTALEHLAATVAWPEPVVYVDEDRGLPELAPGRLVVFTAENPVSPAELATSHVAIARIEQFLLAPWGRDEVLEYLMAAHSVVCAGIAQALTPAWFACIASPALWTVAVDEMARTGVYADPLDAVRTAMARCLDEGEIALDAIEDAMACRRWDPFVTRREPLDVPLRLLTLLAQDVFELHLAVYGVGRLLGTSWVDEHRLAQVARDVPTIAARLREQPHVVSALGRLYDRDPESRAAGQALAILHALGASEVPRRRVEAVGASFDGVDWSHASLGTSYLVSCEFVGARLVGVDLNVADLRGARLAGADLSGSRLKGIGLEHADLVGTILVGADLSRAALRDANLTRVDARTSRWCCADLPRTTLDDAVLADADLTDANLEAATGAHVDFARATLRGARLAKAVLRHARFDGACLGKATLQYAVLAGSTGRGADGAMAELSCADLTASDWSGASLAGARLQHAYLADVCLCGADLSHASLAHARFHFGGSRSGLVGSTIAGEGSRTGFYNDFLVDDRLAPDRSRRADLRDVDLRGADLTGVDFFRVDLRGARFDVGVRTRMAKMGAILD